MAVRVSNPARRRRRSVPVAGAAAAPPVSGYQRVRAFVGLFIFALFFSWLLVVSITWSADLAMSLGASRVGGLSLALLISAVELLPLFILPFVPADGRRLVVVVLVLLSLPFGVFDVLSSSLGLLRVVGWPAEWYYQALFVIPGEFVSFAPERLLALLLGLMWRVLRG